MDYKSEEEEEEDPNDAVIADDEGQIEVDSDQNEEIDLNELEKDLENDAEENEELDEIIDQIKAKNDNSSNYSPYDSDIDDKTNLDSPSSLGIRTNQINLVDLDEDCDSLKLRKQKEISDYIKNSNPESHQEFEFDTNAQIEQNNDKINARKHLQVDKANTEKTNTITTSTTYAKSYSKQPNVIKLN